MTGKSDVAYPDEIPDGALLLDVRTREEFELATIPGAINVPLDELRDRLGELDPGRKIVAFCQVGKRGYFAERILRGNGFDVSNLSGGFTAWRYFNEPFAPIATPTSAENTRKTLKNAVPKSPPKRSTPISRRRSNSTSVPFPVRARSLN